MDSVVPLRHTSARMRIQQRDLHQQLRADRLATRQRIEGMVRPLDGAQLNERVEPERWTIGEVLEHLCLAREAYDAPLAALMRNARLDAGAHAREWSPSFIGGMIAGALERPRAVRAPKLFQPGPTPRSAVIEE